MSDGEELLAILCLLYLSDCFLWIGKNTVAFISPCGARWKIAFAGTVLGNKHGSLVLKNPVPPLGRIFLCHLLPVSVSPIGVCACNVQTLPFAERPIQSGKVFSFESITSSSGNGNYVQVNCLKFVKCADSSQAQAISELINTAVAAVPSEREAHIAAFMDNQFAKEKLAAIMATGTPHFKRLISLCWIFFAFLFVVLPVVTMRFGVRTLVIPAAVVMVVFAVRISIVFFHAHKIFSQGPSQERLSNIVKMILCPPMAIRAADLLTAHLVSKYNPVTVASFLGGRELQKFIFAFVRDLKYPLRHELSDPLGTEITRWYAAEQLRRCINYLQDNNNLGADMLFAPPQPYGNPVSYCPRCQCQFYGDLAECPDCPGVSLHVYGKDSTVEIRQTA